MNYCGLLENTTVQQIKPHADCTDRHGNRKIHVLYLLMTGIGKLKSITYVPWPSLSDGEARSLEALKTPRVIADAAKCRAPTSFLLQDPDGKSFVTSQLPV
jgi:hypothetical protein